MAFVLDASIAARWAFPDEAYPEADLAIEMARTDEAVVPALLVVRNSKHSDH
jgi:hypothetical protein